MMDQTLLRKACSRWVNARFLRLPRSPMEPVMWVDEENWLRFYHPSTALEKIQTQKHNWDDINFQAMVQDIMPEAVDILSGEAASMGMPGNYYSEYPDIVRQYTQAERYAPKEKS